MKKILSLVLALGTFGSISFAQTADEIITKNLEARGGAAKLKALNAVIMEGSMTQGGVDVVMKYYLVQNKASKVEFTAMGQTGYNIVTTNEGWSFNPFQGNTAAEAMTPEAVKDAQIGLDIIPFLDYKTKGYTMEYLGKESNQGNDYYKLKMTRSNGKSVTYLFDKDYLLSKSIQTNNINGTDTEVINEYSDYKKTPEGFVFPYRRVTGQLDITFDKIEVNPKIEESVFKPTN